VTPVAGEGEPGVSYVEHLQTTKRIAQAANIEHTALQIRTYNDIDSARTELIRQLIPNTDSPMPQCLLGQNNCINPDDDATSATNSSASESCEGQGMDVKKPMTQSGAKEPCTHSGTVPPATEFVQAGPGWTWRRRRRRQMRLRCNRNGEQSERGHGGTGVEKKDDRGSSAGNLVAMRAMRVGARRACGIAVT
jgi:hypothetical protein